MKINRTQLNRLARGFPVFAPPTVTQAPYVATETRVGDTVWSEPAVVTPGFPGPLVTTSNLTVGSASESLGYVVQVADVGQSLTRTDAPVNGDGPAAPSTSAPVTIQSLPTFAQMGFLGGNVDNSLDYNTVRLFSNAALDNRGWGLPGSSGGLPGITGGYLSAPTIYPNGTLTLLTASGSAVLLTLSSGVGTTALAGDTTDVGRIFSVGGITATVITAMTTLTCMVSIAGTASGTSFTSGNWSMSGPSLVFSAASGAGVTMRITTSALASVIPYSGSTVVAPLSSSSIDVGRLFALGGGITALVTGFTDAQHCTVTISGGTLPSTTVLAATWSVTVGLNSNGWPLTACENVFGSSTVNNSVNSPTSLDVGTYHWTVKSTSSSIAPNFSGSQNITTTTPTTPVLGGDGFWATTFDMTVGPSGSSQTVIIVNFNTDAAGGVFCPRDGSATIGTQPLFNQAALAYYAQFVKLRFMDFAATNARTDVNWADRPVDYAVCRNRWSWELLVSFVQAIAAYPGSVFAVAQICTPPFATAAYGASLAQLFTAQGWPSAVLIDVERGNEEWNSQFEMFFNDRTQTYNEVNAMSSPSYGSGAPYSITSVVGDGSHVTVTLTAPLPSFVVGPPAASTLIANTVTGNMGAWSQGTYASPISVTSVGTNSFAYSSSNTGTLRISNFTGDSVLTFATTAAGTNVAVSAASVPSVPFNVADIGLLIKVGGVNCQITSFVNTQQVQVTIPAGGVSSATWAAGAWTIAGVQFVVYPNPTSLLLQNNNYNLFQLVSNYHGRAQYQNWNAWKVYRPQDKFLISGQIGNGNIAPLMSFSAFVNGGSATWAYGAVVAPYNTPASTATTTDLVFASMTANLGTLGNGTTSSTGLIAQLQYHVYLCETYGVKPMCYEGGLQFVGNGTGHDVQYACQEDPRMETQMQNLWTAWLQMGGQDWCHYQVSPQPFAFFSALENYANTTSPKLVGLLAAGNTGRSFNEIETAGAGNFWSQSANGTVNTTTLVRYAFTCTVARNYVHTFSINRGRRYQVAIIGTTDTAGIEVTLTLDGAAFGSPMTVAQNGAPSSNSSTPAANIDPFVIEFTSGPHLLIINFPAQATGSAGYVSVTFTPV